jgi:malate dehydrogenase
VTQQLECRAIVEGEIREIELNPAEKAAFEKSCAAVRELIEASRKLVG